jgi:hypothetical protein
MSDATCSIDCWYNWLDALESSHNFPSISRCIALLLTCFDEHDESSYLLVVDLVSDTRIDTTA